MSIERTFGSSNKFARPADDPRNHGRFEGERETLVGYLRNQRLTLELKCSGLDPEDLARRSVEPSNLSLLGLIRHMAWVEQIWFRIRMAGQDVPQHFHTGRDRDLDFNGAIPDPEIVKEAWELWRTETAFTDQYVTDTPDLGAKGASGDALRDVLVHMIEEYARHNGHADFLRERIDGRIGR